MSARTLTWLAAACLLLLPLPALAGPVYLDLGSTSWRQAHASSTLFGRDGWWNGLDARAGLAVGQDFFVGLGLLGLSEEDTAQGGAINTWLEALVMSIEARYTKPLKPWLVPYGRLGAGALRGEYGLGSGATWNAVRWSPQAGLGLGLEVLVPARSASRPEEMSRAFSFGLGLELGWQHVFGQDLVLESEREVTPKPGGKQELELGELWLTGAYVRLALCLRL